MRALGRRGPGIFPRKFKPLLDGEEIRLWPSFRTWVERAAAGDIVAAYEASRNPNVRSWMCYRVGKRELHAALPMLVHALNDPDEGVRGEAADALGYIGDPRTGCDLFKRLALGDSGVEYTLLLALGSTRYAPALPALIEALADADPWARYHAAWGLAAMGDKSALPALRQAYAEESEREYSYDSTKESLRCAIDELEGS